MNAATSVPTRLRVASGQFQLLPGDKSANLATIHGFVQQAAGREVRMIVFPECCISGYWGICVV